MKRLLAYLFLVLGLGLVVNVNANAKGVCVKIVGSYKSTSMQEKIVLKTPIQELSAEYIKWGRNKNKSDCEKESITRIYIDKKLRPELYTKLKKVFARKSSCNYRKKNTWKDINDPLHKDYFNCAHGGQRTYLNGHPELIKLYAQKTQIAKVEPSQTQGVAEKKKPEEKKKLKKKLITLSKCHYKSDTKPRVTGSWIKVWGVQNSFQSDVFVKNQYIIDLDTLDLWHNWRFTDEYHKILVGDNKSKVKLLSSEQQKKVKHLEIPQERKNKLFLKKKGFTARYDDVNQLIVYEQKFSDNSYFTSDKKNIYEDLLNKKGLIWSNIYSRETIDLTKGLIISETINLTSPSRKKVEQCDTPFSIKSDQDIAKTTQEEFKPEDKDIDNDPPVIQIAEAITVDSQAYTLKGKVKDKSKIYLTIDGRQVQVKKGKFKVDRFNIDPDEVEEIKIVAIDKWNNKTEKTIKVTIDLKSTELARSFEDLKPNSVRVKTDKNKIAIIIGIEKYENLINLDAKYANRDAQAFRTYATKALGIKPSNIKVLIDDKANRGNTLEAFKLWLPKIANNDGKDIYVFFAGHGLASENGEDLYILPQDGNAKLLDDTAITRVELISLIQKVNPKSVTMFFDTCYSGQTRDERMLVASLLRPIQIVAEEQDTPDNFTIFSASNFDQASGGIEEAKHGMFSYYLMKGLEGKADNNKDKKITNGELIAYLKTNVSKEAFTQNREQDPMLSGDPDQILMSYR